MDFGVDLVVWRDIAGIAMWWAWGEIEEAGEGEGDGEGGGEGEGGRGREGGREGGGGREMDEDEDEDGVVHGWGFVVVAGWCILSTDEVLFSLR